MPQKPDTLVVFLNPTALFSSICKEKCLSSGAFFVAAAILLFEVPHLALDTRVNTETPFLILL